MISIDVFIKEKRVTVHVDSSTATSQMASSDKQNKEK